MSFILYGGLFDPPHKGHLEIAHSAIRHVRPNLFFWIPSRYPPHRERGHLPAEKRLDLLRAWLHGRNEFRVSDMELDDSHSGYTVETVERFRNIYPEENCYLLIGSDEAEVFDTWHRWEDILAAATVLIGRRKESFNMVKELKKRAIVLDNTIMDISSASIRRELAAGGDVSGLLEEDLMDIINEKGYYIGR